MTKAGLCEKCDHVYDDACDVCNETLEVIPLEDIIEVFFGRLAAIGIISFIFFPVSLFLWLLFCCALKCYPFVTLPCSALAIIVLFCLHCLERKKWSVEIKKGT